MDEQLTELSEELTAQARHIVQCHIDQLNKDYLKAVDKVHDDFTKLTLVHKRGTWIVWAMFWLSGFLARGIFSGQLEWNLASFAVGTTAGVMLYWSVYGLFHLAMMRKQR